LNRAGDTRSKLALFSYGTLQRADAQQKLFGRRLAGTPDRLAGYELTTIDISSCSYPAAVASTTVSNAIDGRMLLLTHGEVTAADRYEGADYKRVAVNLQSGRRAFVYVKA
jgi:hypothetical protein